MGPSPKLSPGDATDSERYRVISDNNCEGMLKVVECWVYEGWMEACSEECKDHGWGHAGGGIMLYPLTAPTLPSVGHWPSCCHFRVENTSDSDNNTYRGWVSPWALHLPSPYHPSWEGSWLYLRKTVDQEKQEVQISISDPKEIKRDIGNMKQVQVVVEEKQEDILDMRKFITKNLKKLLKDVFGRKAIKPRKKECDAMLGKEK